MRASRFRSPNSARSAAPGASAGARKKRTDTEHISGAEGIYEAGEIEKKAAQYIRRALGHSRGTPDSITVTIEKIYQKPHPVTLLPLRTLESDDTDESAILAEQLLRGLGIADRALHQAFRILRAADTMRGASLVLCRSGRRVEPDRNRGVRVSLLGLSRSASRSLSGMLARKGLHNRTVKEAIVLASKVASCKGVLAEICISDDPGYTTGYVSSLRTGYVRIPHMKQPGSRSGGRVFFLEENADIGRIISYLEKSPVIVSGSRSGGASQGA